MASDAPPRFFVLKNAMDSSHDTDFERSGRTIGEAGEAPRCHLCGSFIGMRAWLPPRRGELTLYGTAFGDYIKGPGSGHLLSARFVEAFRAEGLTGLSDFDPVEIVRVRTRRRSAPKIPPPYFHTVPVFGGAAVDEARSRIRRHKPIDCDWCRETNVPAIHGFTLEQWRGEDVFFARGMPGSPIVSERFVRFVERHQFTNMKLIPTEKYTWDPMGLGPLRPEL
ncbi:hypothetical protein BO221_34345 [Archangium sp. Cb G35]|uniref:hypothetical protein n=1 Tax=Archangium sp. Cb G35 TaxID=1920190 RepID=UPI000935D407|nr:hypothetical protein [Archangium sp. Cb G35]OJT19468.1 hypothetical protein BO221_34345 [Archangium sp. Cb G35]